MNNEIKEILRTLKAKSTRYEYCLKENISYNDESYEAHLLLDYINSLQQENERLKVNCNLGYEELKVARDYKSRCEKAIEYINKLKTYPYLEKYYTGELLNILQNGSDSQ